MLSKAKPCLEEEKVLSWFSLQRQKWAGSCRTVMKTDLNSLGRWHHVVYSLDCKEDLSLCI